MMVMIETKITMNENATLFGILSTEHHNLKDKAVNSINMIKLVVKYT